MNNTPSDGESTWFETFLWAFCADEICKVPTPWTSMRRLWLGLLPENKDGVEEGRRTERRQHSLQSLTCQLMPHKATQGKKLQAQFISISIRRLKQWHPPAVSEEIMTPIATGIPPLSILLDKPAQWSLGINQCSGERNTLSSNQTGPPGNRWLFPVSGCFKRPPSCLLIHPSTAFDLWSLGPQTSATASPH